MQHAIRVLLLSALLLSVMAFPVTAEAVNYTITASTSEGGSISPSGPVSVPEGANQSFTIEPETGFNVQDVLVDNVSQGPVRDYTFTFVQEDHSIEAAFTPETTAVKFRGDLLEFDSRDGGGSFLVNITDILEDPGHILTPGETVEVTYRSGLPPPYQQHYHIDPNVTEGTVVEVFCTAEGVELELLNGNYVRSLTTFIITTTAGPGGTITPGDAVFVQAGADQECAISASNGYSIADVKVDGASEGPVTTYTFFDVMADHDITARFTPETSQVRFRGVLVSEDSRPGGGEVVVDITSILEDPGQILAIGERVTVSFQTGLPPGGQQHFEIDPNLTAGNLTEVFCTSSGTALSLRNGSYVRALESYTILANAGEGGTITPSGTVLVAEGSDQTFLISADEGFSISDVVIDGFPMGQVIEYTFIHVDADHQISAVFREEGVPVRFQGDLIKYESRGGGGSFLVTITEVLEDPDHRLGVGDTVEVTYRSGLPPPFQQNYHIDPNVEEGEAVEVQCTATSSALELRDGDYFRALTSRIIIATAGTGGRISPAGWVFVPEGENRTFTISPSNGYTTADVVVDGQSGGALTSYTFSDVRTDHTISAIFSPEISQVTFQGLLTEESSGLGGGYFIVEITKILEDPLQILAVGEPVKISYSAGLPPPYQPHYEIDPNATPGSFVEVFCNATGSSLSLRTGNYIRALASYTITASAGEGGTISPSGSITVLQGDSQDFTIIPDTGFSVDDVIVDGVSRGPLRSYTFTDVTANHTISATFSEISETGLLWVASYPRGATIYIDGSVRGSTNQFVYDVPAGIRNVTLVKGGYLPATLMVDVRADDLKVLPPVTLRPDGGPSGTGTLYIGSVPSGATIFIDGTVYGQTNGFAYNVPSGVRNLTLARTGYRTKTISVQVPAGDLKVLAPINLERAIS